MNIEQINSLQISDCLPLLISRLDLEAPTQAELQAELEVYKAELIAEINRLEDLKARYENLSDKGIIQALGISNPDLHFAQEVLLASAEIAESKMVEMEIHYSNFLQSINSQSWLEARQQAYKQIDELLLEALAEQFSGRPEKMEEYLILREQIRLQYPKPE